MSGSANNKYRLPNSSVPIQGANGYVNHAWYLYLGQLGRETQEAAAGLASLGVGPGLVGTDASGKPTGTLTSTGTISLSLDYYGEAPGTMLARGPQAWQGLAPGGQGQVLTANGTGQLPSWEALQDLELPNVDPVAVLGNAGSAPAPAASVLVTLLLDALLGNQWGTVVFRGQNGWQGLAPGEVPGLVLSSGGPGGDIYWARTTAQIARSLCTRTLHEDATGTVTFSPLGYADASGNQIVLSDGLGVS